MPMISAVRNQSRAFFGPAEQLAKNRLFSLFLSFLSRKHSGKKKERVTWAGSAGMNTMNSNYDYRLTTIAAPHTIPQQSRSFYI